LFEEEKPQSIPITIHKETSKKELSNFKKAKTNLGLKIMGYSGLLVLVVVFGFAFVNAPALYQYAKYFYKVQLLDTAYNESTNSYSAEADVLPTTDQNRILISKIGVNSPIIWNVNENDLKQQLANGVVQLSGSSLPSTNTGNVYLVGNSSYFWWNNSPYNAVFALLGNLNINDEITITDTNNIYTYRVTNTEIIESSNISIVNPTNKKILTLMTYTPIGTYLNKLLVTAELAGQTNNNTSTSTPVTTTNPTPKTTQSTTPSPNTELLFLPNP